MSNNDTTRKQVESSKKPTDTEEANDQNMVPNKNTENPKRKEDQPINIHERKEEAQKKEKAFIPPLPYPQRFNKEPKDQHFCKFLETFKKLEINILLAEALEQMPLYAKFLKELINKKRSWLEKETVLLTEECSALIRKRLPPKLEDPGSFFIPCTVGSLFINKGMCDLGSSINLIPSSLVKKLCIEKVKPIQMSLELVDQSIVHPKGAIENLLVKVDKFIYPADFVILETEEEGNNSIILGRPFLATARAIIDVEQGELTLRMHEESITLKVFPKQQKSEERSQVINDCFPRQAINNSVKQKNEHMQGKEGTQKETWKINKKKSATTKATLHFY